MRFLVLSEDDVRIKRHGKIKSLKNQELADLKQQVIPGKPRSLKGYNTVRPSRILKHTKKMARLVVPKQLRDKSKVLRYGKYSKRLDPK
jgi:hypothetical protein